MLNEELTESANETMMMDAEHNFEEEGKAQPKRKP